MCKLGWAVRSVGLQMANGHCIMLYHLGWHTCCSATWVGVYNSAKHTVSRGNGCVHNWAQHTPLKMNAYSCNCCAWLQEDSTSAMLGCAWSRCGTYIAAGSRDCNVYMWHWAVSSPDGQGPGQQHAGSAAALHAADWPLPVPLPALRGHSKGVWQVEFNHAGNMLASGSMDGSARVGGLL